VVAAWPAADPTRHDSAAEGEIAALQAVVVEVRRFRSDQGLRPTQRVPARLAGLDAVGLVAHESRIRAMTRLDPPAGEFAATASVATAGVRVELDLSGVIDVAAERRRLEKDLAAAEKERAQVSAKLGNESFMAKAPEAVVTKVRERLSAAEAGIARITGQLAALPPR
jgi:valyl-tRNA synthetase